jgi:hypothetical protein
MNPRDFVDAARVSATLQPQRFGLWTIDRVCLTEPTAVAFAGCQEYTLLGRFTETTLMTTWGDIVMEDSPRELRRHLPIWLAARGRVLVTGLGLGCVVRGLLASPRVENVDVLEIDPEVVRVVGAEFLNEPRVTLHVVDALTYEWPSGSRWDFAWHDLWSEDSLPVLHAALIQRMWPMCGQQGAWGWPREIRGLLGGRLIGTPRRRRAA